MKKLKVNIIFPKDETDSMAERKMLPALGNALRMPSHKVQQFEVDTISKSLLELLGSLQNIVQKIGNKVNSPAKVVFSLGIDANGEIGILSTVSSSLSHGTSIAIEFEVKPTARRTGKGKK